MAPRVVLGVVVGLLATPALMLASPGSAGYVATGTLLDPADPTFTGWDQAGVHSVVDQTDHANQAEGNFHRVWLTWGTPAGGQTPASADNQVAYLYLRFDHKGPTQSTLNFHLQMNLGAAPPGKVDHLLSMRAGTGSPSVQVRLSEYDHAKLGGWPDLGAFTTSFLTHRFSNHVGGDGTERLDTLHRTGVGSEGYQGFEVAIPASWLEDAPASRFRADGSSAVWASGAVFSTVGAFGAVATPKDVLCAVSTANCTTEGSPDVVVFVADLATGTTFSTRTAAHALAFTAPPADIRQGHTLPDILVEVVDEAGQRVHDATHEVHLRLGDGPSGANASLSGTTSVRAVGGVATFHGLSVDAVGAGYTLHATAGGIWSAVSDAFNVSAPPVAAIEALPVPVDDLGRNVTGRWGGWSSQPGRTDVRSTNHLVVRNTGEVDEAAFRIAFAPTFEGVEDSRWTLDAALLEFRCAYQQSPDDTPRALLAAAPWHSDAPGSAACTFPVGSAGGGIMFVQYRFTALPAVLRAQDYQSSFTVTLEE